ncbi:Protein CBG03691 [Caenorhabditis briggsae]|uniref:Uncharacterized protein n=2 Tax=Caenorhabditis briggsae TaxID=6238 RepID=A0AAE9IST0_CAEBR|nr:Protein CBG03691 [Caenorhabditis briggsae]ULU04083.1 hypothetical protein L3Y34_017109 [Caenorhabditis briggsae]ULU04084.1 hypothetical protein L3Y34_017110 [Caenorhabditis briggsae]CAP24528.2 Protein CBG03691 [Caenorhabditis briggsae]
MHENRGSVLRKPWQTWTISKAGKEKVDRDRLVNGATGCEIYHISMNYDKSHPFNKMLSGKCKSSSRMDSKIRTSRSTAVIGAVVTIGFAFYVLGQNLYDSFFYKPHVEKQITLLQDAMLKMQKAENLTIADIEELSDLFSAAQWAEIRSTIFETSKLEKIMNICYECEEIHSRNLCYEVERTMRIEEGIRR